MATRKKTSDPWQAEGTATLSNGLDVTRWSNTTTGEVRLVPDGLHPTDQPLADQPLALVGETEPDEQPEETPLDRVATLLSYAAGDDRAYVALYRLNKGQREWCRKYRPDELDEGSFDLIRTDFGPGEYELRLYATDPRTNKFVVRRSSRVAMAEPPHRAPEAGLPSGLSQVLTTIAQGQEQMLRALVEMKQAPQKDPMEEMTKMLGMMTMMREAMGLNQAQAAPARSSIGEIVEAIKELRGAAAEVMPEKEEPSDLMGMLPKVLELVQAGSTQQSQQAAHHPAMLPSYGGEPDAVLSPVTLPPAFAAQATQDPQTQEREDVNPLKLLKLRGYLKTLVDHAEKGTPVPDCATFVYEKLPDELIDLMELPTWFDLLAAVAPEVKAHKDYLTQVRDAAMKMFTDEENAG